LCRLRLPFGGKKMKRLFVALIIICLIGLGIGPVDTYKGQDIRLGNFKSEQELDAFLLGYKFMLEAGMRGSTTNWDCDDYALDLVSYSWERNKAIYPEWEWAGKKWGDKRLKKCHLGCATIIDNNIYFIEPRTGEWWFVAYLD